MVQYRGKVAIWSMEFLEDDGFLDFSALMRAAVYALVRRKEVVYIGQSVTPISRVYGHRQGWSRRMPKKKVSGIVFDEVWIRPCHQYQLNDVEQELIRKYQPRHNIRHKPMKAPPDLAEIMQVLLPQAVSYPIAEPTEPRTYIRRRL